MELLPKSRDVENQRPLPPRPRIGPREDVGGPLPLEGFPLPAWVGAFTREEVVSRVFQTLGRWYRSP